MIRKTILKILGLSCLKKRKLMLLIKWWENFSLYTRCPWILICKIQRTLWKLLPMRLSSSSHLLLIQFNIRTSDFVLITIWSMRLTSWIPSQILTKCELNRLENKSTEPEKVAPNNSCLQLHIVASKFNCPAKK